MKKAKKTAKAASSAPTPRRTATRKVLNAGNFSARKYTQDEAEHMMRHLEQVRGRKFDRPKGWGEAKREKEMNEWLDEFAGTFPKQKTKGFIRHVEALRGRSL
jgi:hypothetical protein